MVFGLLGITVGDFMVAGGVILFCIAIIDIIRSDKQHRMPGDIPGVVPLGTPLIVGPAVLTTSLIIIEVYGLFATMVSVLVNVLLAGLVFSLSKVMSLLLAAIAVMMIRKGILRMLMQ